MKLERTAVVQVVKQEEGKPLAGRRNTVQRHCRSGSSMCEREQVPITHLSLLARFMASNTGLLDRFDSFRRILYLSLKFEGSSGPALGAFAKKGDCEEALCVECFGTELRGLGSVPGIACSCAVADLGTAGCFGPSFELAEAGLTEVFRSSCLLAPERVPVCREKQPPIHSWEQLLRTCTGGNTP